MLSSLFRDTRQYNRGFPKQMDPSLNDSNNSNDTNDIPSSHDVTSSKEEPAGTNASEEATTSPTKEESGVVNKDANNSTSDSKATSDPPITPDKSTTPSSGENKTEKDYADHLLVLQHGLHGSNKDFDYVKLQMEKKYKGLVVVCPDIILL